MAAITRAWSSEVIGGVAADTHGQAQGVCLCYRLGEDGEPLGEEGGAKVNSRYGGPIQEPLSKLVFTRSIAFGVAASGDLRHVDHRLQTGVRGCLGKDAGRLDEPASIG
jgi:hypothetical protein